MNNKLNILLVEDNPGDARFFTEMISYSEFIDADVENVQTLSDAITILKDDRFDIVVLDLGLPDTKGFDTFNKLNNEWSSGPVIVMTGIQDKTLGRTIVRMGAQDFLVKGSYDDELLNKSIEYAIDRYKSKEIIQSKEKHFREIIEKNADGMIVTDENQTILYVNPVAELLLNNNNKNLVGTTIPFPIKKEVISEVELIDTFENKLIVQVKVVGAHWEGSKANIATLRDITELKENQVKVEHLNCLLKTIGEINHLIVTEKDKTKLLETACSLLVEGRSYKSAWIGLVDENRKIDKIYSFGLSDHFNKFEDYVLSGGNLYCKNQLDKFSGVQRIFDSAGICDTCPLSKIYTGKGGLAVDISHKNKSLGVIVVSRPSSLIHEKQEESLLLEVAADLGLALHTLSVEEKVVESQNRLLWLNESLNSAANTVVLTDKQGIIQWVNPAFTKLTGYTAEEVIGQNPNILKSDKHNEKFYNELWQTISSGKIWRGEITNRKKDGTLYDEEMTITPVKNEIGEIKHFIAIKSDITERKKTEKEREKNRELFKALFDLAKLIDESEETILSTALEDAVKFTESEGGYLHFMNSDKVTLQLFKWSKSVNKICNAEKNDHYPLDEAGIWAECIRTRKAVIHNNYQERKDKKGLPDGHFPVLRHMSIPVFDGSDIIAVCGVGNKKSDYTDEDSTTLSLFMNEMWKLVSKKRSDEKVKNSEERFRGFFENSTIGLYRKSATGEIIEVNTELLNMLGYKTFDELKRNMNVNNNYVNPSQKTTFDNIIKSERVIHGYEAEWFKADGSKLVVSESARAQFNADGEIIFYEGAVVDITEQKKSQELVKKSEIQFRSVWENSFDGMRLTNSEGVIIQTNEAFNNIVELSRHELIGQLFSVPYKNKTEKALIKFKENFKSQKIQTNYESEIILHNGAAKWVSLSNSYIQIDQDHILLSIFRDITQSKTHEIELKNALKKAESSDKLKSQFLAQISHEIRTPLNVIISFSDMLREDLNEHLNDELDSSFRAINSAGKRLIRTVDLTLNMSEIQLGTYEPVLKDIDVYEEILVSIHPEMHFFAESKGLRFAINNTLESPIKNIDSYSLGQIFINLIDNAIKFTNEGFVEVILFENDEHKPEIHIKDSGIGISEDYLKRIFEPYSQEIEGYTRAYEGNGLGLTLVKHFCDLNKITLKIESKKERGSNFILVFNS